MSVTLIVGDLHLGKGVSIGKPGLGNALNSRIVDQIKLLDWVFERAIDRHADCIILTGDICESPKPDYILIELFTEFLKKCESYNIYVHIIAGNHDLKRTGSRRASYLDLIAAMDIPTVRVHKNIKTVFREGVAFTLMPFRDMRSMGCADNETALDKLSELLPYELAEIPPTSDKVLVGHLAIEGSIYVGDEFDNLANELMCPPEMFHGYEYVWMGHVHRPQELCDDPYVAHVGSLDISDFGETDHAKLIIVYDTENPNKFDEITIPTRPLRHIPVNVPAGFDSTIYVLKNIRAVHKAGSLKNAIVKVEIKLLDESTDGVNRDAIEEEIYNLGAFHICSLQESRMVSVASVSQQLIADNTIKPRAAIDIYADATEFESVKHEQDFIEMCRNIVEEQDIKYGS